MRDKMAARILFVLCAITLVLPWFTCSGAMMRSSWIAVAMHILLLVTVSFSAAKGERGRRGT